MTVGKMEKIVKDKLTRPNLRDWSNASRPQYYIATIIPITLGFVLAGKVANMWSMVTYLLVLFASFLVHLATNLANDLFDEVDNENTIGGSLARQQGKISPRDYKLALIFLYGLYIILSPFIIIPSKMPILWFFAGFGIFSSIYYTAPPIRYGYRALGEVLVFINMGLIMVCGSYMACAHTFQKQILAFGVIIGLMVAGILYFQSLPEIETDGNAGKRTLAVRLGMQKAFLLYYIWWPVIWLLIIMLWFTDNVEWPALCCLFSVPFYFMSIKAMSTTTKATLLALDSKGFLIRIMYLITGIAIILGVIPF